MSQQHRVAVFGSSFVARLANSPFYHMQIPQIGVKFYGVGGLQLEEVSKRPEWKQMKLSRPSIVVFHCGGNSIRRGTSALQLFNLLMSLLRELHWNPLVAVVEIPSRGKLNESRRVRCHAERTKRGAPPKIQSQFRQTSTVHHQMY